MSKRRIYLDDNPPTGTIKDYDFIPSAAFPDKPKYPASGALAKDARTLALELGPAFAIAGGIPLALSTGRAIMNNPFVDAAFTVDAAVNAPSRTKEAINNFKEGRYLKGLGNVATLGLDAYGTVNLVKKGVKTYKTLKNFVGSRRYQNRIAEEFADAINSYDTNREAELYKQFYGDNADVTELSYFRTDIDKATQSSKNPRVVRARRGRNVRRYKFPDAESATEYVHDINDGTKYTVSHVIKDANEEFNKLKSGHRISLSKDEALSRDSYPLLLGLSERRQLRNQGRLIPIIDNGNYRMIKLNRYGKLHGVERIDEHIESVRRLTKDKNIPNRLTLPFSIDRFVDENGKIRKQLRLEKSYYVPAFAFEKFKNGGIYIKPSHRGRFTALKERTSHSATWFKENGTPAQKKMATFALNAAKWNH